MAGRHVVRRATAHAHLATVNGSRKKIVDGQVVKANIWWSNILTPVAAMDTVPIGVTPLD